MTDLKTGNTVDIQGHVKDADVQRRCSRLQHHGAAGGQVA